MEWKHEKRELSSLYENPHNPRRLSKFAGQELRKSLRKFGQCEPVVIQPDGEIIGGHQRVRLLKKMGAQHVDVSVPESPLGKRDANELTIRLNKNTGDWDDDILANEWEEELLLESGFTIEELGMEVIEEDSKKKDPFILTAKFENEDDLREAELDIAAIVSKYATASYKCRVPK